MSRVSTAGPETAALASQITARDELDLQKKQMGLQAQQLRLQQQQQQIELEGMRQQGQLAREQMKSQEQQTAAELAQRTYFADQRFQAERETQQAGFQQERTMFDLAAEESARDFEERKKLGREQYLQGKIDSLTAEERAREANSAAFRAQTAAKMAELKSNGQMDQARRMAGALSQDIVTRLREAETSVGLVGTIGESLSEITGGIGDMYSNLLVQRATVPGDLVSERDLTGRTTSVLEQFQGGRVTWNYDQYLEADNEYRSYDPGSSAFWRPLTATLEAVGLKQDVKGGEFGVAARTRIKPIDPEDATRLMLLEASRRIPDATGRQIGGSEVAKAFEVVESLVSGSVKDVNLVRQEIEQLTGGRGELIFSAVQQMRTQMESTQTLGDLERRLSPEDFKTLKSAAGGRENLQAVLESSQAVAKRLFQFEAAMKDAGFMDPADAVSDLEALVDVANQLDLMGSMSPEAVQAFRDAGMGDRAEQLQRALEGAEITTRASLEEQLAILGESMESGQTQIDAERRRAEEELAALGVGGGGE